MILVPGSMLMSNEEVEELLKEMGVDFTCVKAEWIDLRGGGKMIKWLEYDTDKFEAFGGERDSQHEFYIRLEPEEVEGLGRMWRLRVSEIEHIDTEMQRADLIDEKFFATLSRAKAYAEERYSNHGEAIK